MFKKILSLCLVIILIFTATIPVYSNTTAEDFDFTVIEEYVGSEYWVEISQYNETIFYFRDTTYYTLTMELNLSNGTLNVYRYDKQTDILSFENDLVIPQKSRTVSIDNAVEIIKYNVDKVYEGIIGLDNTLTVLREETVNSRSRVTNANVIRQLRDLGHTARAWARTGNSLTSHGFTARLYERVTFNSVSITAISITAGLTMSAVAALVGKPATAVRTLVRTVVNVAGTVITASASTLNRHRVSVAYTREGRIAPYPGGWAIEHRDLQYDITVGDGGSTAWTNRWSASWQRTITQILRDSIDMRR